MSLLNTGQLAKGNRFDRRTHPKITNIRRRNLTFIGNDLGDGQPAHPRLAGAHSTTDHWLDQIRAQGTQAHSISDLTNTNLFTATDQSLLILWNQPGMSGWEECVEERTNRQLLILFLQQRSYESSLLC